jgi:hypothetical protein
MDMTVAHSGLVTRILNGATATGAGTAYKMQLSAMNPQFPLRVAWCKTVSGTVSTCTVNLEGSLDGTNFFQLDTDNTTAATLKWVSDKPVLWIRANVTTLTGAGATVNVDIVPNHVG